MSPLAWLIATEFLGLGVALRFNAPLWITAIVGVAIGLSILAYLVTFGVFAKNNPDLLRSERYNISKLAIEKNLLGDSVVGVMEVDPTRRVEPGTAPPKLTSGDE